MPKITINGQTIAVEPGTTVLEAARLAGIIIPVLCDLKGLPHFTSCMVCVVQEKTSGRLIPSCSALTAEGMIVETDTNEVHHARIASLNLLMSEHAGDCEAPCTTTCPAHLQIPLMIRQIAKGKLNDAIATLYDTIALPSVLGRICPAPCEKACRRGRIDSPLAICLLDRFVGDEYADAQASYAERPAPSPSKPIAIVGAGPTGLAAAFHLSRAGYSCTIFDDRAEPGGQLRYSVPEHVLPRSVLDREIQRIHKLGVSFRMGTRLGSRITLQDLKTHFAALVLAFGKTTDTSLVDLGITVQPQGIKVDTHTFRTSDDRVFAGGEAVQAGHMAVRAVAHGKSIAVSIDQFLRGLPVTGPVRRFESRLGKIKDTESRELLKEAAPTPRIRPGVGPDAGFTANEARRESGRCMHCDCRKAEACKLRDYMEIHMSGPLHSPADGRKPVERNTSHPLVIFEPGKCIHCGICVRITTQAGEKPGLTFLGRGFDAVVGVPFEGSLEAALGQSAAVCVRECPTGALAWKDC
ncbi:MAG: FAD-dependent oxidoreductase [bacterium]|jgi:ferredoxin